VESLFSRTGKFGLTEGEQDRFSSEVHFDHNRSTKSKEAGMKLHLKLALVTGALALALVPAMAVADPSYHPTGPHYTPSPGPPAHAKAYGKHCQGFSKKHVKGVPGTPFSRCVKAMARADKDAALTARKACKALSKKHVKGAKGTPFSRCVKGVAHMRKEAAQV
jgi:hypothetical protein